MFTSNLTWLVQEANHLHGYFSGLFYVLITVFLSISVVAEYFKFPLGGIPAFGVILGRCFVAVILLVSYKEIANTIAVLSDSMSQDLGNLAKLDGVLDLMAERIEDSSMDWLNAKSLVITILSVLTYSFLFYAVLIAQIAHVFSWTLLYVFSPLLIAFFVMPATAGATKALYRSMLEVAGWKIVFAVLSSLLFASVLVELPAGGPVDLIYMIGLNLMLGAAVISTPWMVHGLMDIGLSGFTRNFAGISTPFGMVTPRTGLNKLKGGFQNSQKIYRFGSNATKRGADFSKGAALFAKNPVQNTKAVIGEGKSSMRKSFSKLPKFSSEKKTKDHKTRLDKAEGSNSKTKRTLPPTSWQKFRSKNNAVLRERKRPRRHDPRNQNSI